nr:hypothetical protein Itr_chr09CG10680 [Ipomoea trifida]
MASSYTTFFMFLCVAIMATTKPSSAFFFVRPFTVNLNGALVCDLTGTPAEAGVTVSLLCSLPFAGVVAVVETTTTDTGTISGASTNIGILTGLFVSPKSCELLASPIICSDSLPPNTTSLVGAPISVSRNLGMIAVSPAGRLNPLRTLSSLP